MHSRTVGFEKCGQSAVHAQKPPELLGVLSKFLPHNDEQSASQGPDCPPHKEAPQVSGVLVKRTGGQSAPQGRTARRGQKAPHQKHSVSGGFLSHHCGQSAQRARTVRRGLRGSNQKHKVSGAHSGLTSGQSAPEARTVRSSPEPCFQKIFKLAAVSFEIRAQVSPHANYQLYDL